MKKLDLNYTEGSYSIVIDYSYDNLYKYLKQMYSSDIKILIITDSNVGSIYLESLEKELKNNYHNVISYKFTAGEASKNLITVNGAYDKLIEHNFNRNDLILALGGGVVGDLSGYVASTYMRGIDYIQLPTTLLSQVDSSIGGKTGVDYKGYKNIVGAFKKPKLVYTNLATLKTLDLRQISSGMAEIIKHGFILDKSYLAYLKNNSKEILDLNMAVIEKVVYESCKIKQSIVEKDFKEGSIRAILNFGHTIGHAIEKFEYTKLFHGECVSIGAVAALYISYKKGFLSINEIEASIDILKCFNLPTSYKIENTQLVLDALKVDKKALGESIKWILLKPIGNAIIDTDVSPSLIKEAIEYVNK